HRRGVRLDVALVGFVLERQLDAARSRDYLYGRLLLQHGPRGVRFGCEARVVRMVIRQPNDSRVVLRAAVGMAQCELLEGQHLASRPSSQPVGRTAADPAATENDVLIARLAYSAPPPDQSPP